MKKIRWGISFFKLFIRWFSLRRGFLLVKIVYSFTLSGLFIALFSNAILTKEAKSESLYVPQEKDSPANIR
ncbi:MAG: hypothetical protein AAB069_07195, partial [Planctomycetota bacterium]